MGAAFRDLLMITAVVIDLGMGNIRSLASALTFLGVDYVVTDQASALDKATHIILPGVGAFDAAMLKLQELLLGNAIREHVLFKKKPIIGICLGMQLLCSSSEEGQLPGLGLIDEGCTRLGANAAANRKVPHVGFSEVYDY
jgi:glutamine amidotransferase